MTSRHPSSFRFVRAHVETQPRWSHPRRFILPNGKSQGGDNLKWKCGWWTFWVPPPKKSLVNGLQRNKPFWYHRGHSEVCIDLQLMCVFDSLCFWHQSWQIEWFFHLNSCEPTMRAISNVHQCRYLKHEKIYQLSQQTCPLFAWQSERNRFYCDQPHLKTSWFNVGFGTVSFATHDPNTVNFNPLKEWAALTKNGDQLKPVFVNAFLYFLWGVRSGLEFQSYHPTDEFFQISRSFPIISALRENPLVVRRSIVFAVPRCYGSFAWRGKCHIVAWQKQGRREGQLWSSVGGPTDFCESHGFKGTVPKVLKQAAQLDMWHVDFIERSRGTAGFWANEQNVRRGYLEKLQILTSIAVNCGAASAEAISHQLRISESLTPERYPRHLWRFFDPKNLQPKNRGICGKLIVATGEAQLSQLHALEMKAVRAVGNVKVRQNRKGEFNKSFSKSPFF